MNKRRSALKKRLRANKLTRYKLDGCALFGVRELSVLSRLLQTNNKSLRLACNSPEFAVWTDNTKPLKPRHIQDPRGLTERLHYRLCELLDRVVKPDFLHSATRKRSAVTNAARHISKAPCVMTDMKSFYEVTTTQQVADFFGEDLHMAPDLARKLAQLCTVNGHLPTGSPLSPLLAYWAHHRTFGHLYDLSCGMGIVMTVYVDDLAFSGERASLAFLHIVKQILRRRGLHTHKDKSFGAGQFKHITGAAVSPKGLHVPNNRLKRIVDGIGELIVVSDLEQRAYLRRRLVGRIASASAISRRIGNALKRRHSQSAVLSVTD